MRTFWQDLRYAARSLARRPGFAAIAVLTLAAGSGVSGALWGLSGAVEARGLAVALGLLLLAACVNGANLLLERAWGRRREIAIRTTLGAGRGRLVRQLLTESLLVGVLGGMLGLIVAIWGIALAVKVGSAGMPGLAETRLNAQVVIGTLGCALAGGVAIGLLPAWDSSRAEFPALGRELRRVTLTRGLRGRGLLAIAEIALAAVLLACAGGMARSGFHLVETWLRVWVALLALVQAGFALYGAMSWSVAVRTPEFRLRVALGARAADMRRLVMREGLRLALAGTTLGLAAGWMLAPPAADAAVWVSVSILLAGVAMLACRAPARRAGQADPLAAIRCD